MGEKDNDKERFSDLISFVRLSKAVKTPRQTLITWHKILKFPAVIPEDKVQKRYPLTECIMILDLFKAEQEKGFKRDFAAKNVRKSEEMKKILEQIREKYKGCKIIL